jgi:hypothetical protein
MVMIEGALLVDLSGKGHSQAGGGGEQRTGCCRGGGGLWEMVVAGIKQKMDGARRVYEEQQHRSLDNKLVDVRSKMTLYSTLVVPGLELGTDGRTSASRCDSNFQNLDETPQ